jgi:hypothetical protein
MTYSTSFKTTWILLTIIAILIGWDLYARQFPGGTISEVILTASKHPIFPFLGGVLGGHLFWPQMEKPQ